MFGGWSALTSLLLGSLTLSLSGCGTAVTTTTEGPWPWPTTDEPSDGPSMGPSTGPSAGPVCEELPATECLGEDLAFRQYTSPDPEDCCTLCSNTPACKAWSFEHAEENSMCFLKHACDLRAPSAKHTSGRTGHMAQCKQLPGTDCLGRDMGLGKEVDDAEDCCDLCDRTANCTAFSFRAHDFHNNRSWCYLKTGCTTQEENPNVTSGTNGKAPPSQCPLSIGERCMGPELYSGRSPNPSACCDLCTLTQGCAAFRWESNSSQPRCTLLTTCLETAAAQDAVSGSWGYPSQCSVALYETDCIGEEIGGDYAWSYDGCCNMCGATPGCNAFTYNELDFHPEGQYCYLRGSCDKANRTYSNVSTSGFLPKCWSKWGERCVDHEILGKSLKQQEDCCDLCSTTAGCTAWTHAPYGDKYHSTAWCYLHTSCNTTEDCGDCTTGFYRGFDPEAPTFEERPRAPPLFA